MTEAISKRAPLREMIRSDVFLYKEKPAAVSFRSRLCNNGTPGETRTHYLTLRSDLETRLWSHFLYPIIPYFQGFFAL